MMLKLQNFEILNKIFKKKYYFINCYLIIYVIIINIENEKSFSRKLIFFITKIKFRIKIFRKHYD